MITARTIKKTLVGQSFYVANDNAGEDVMFSFPDTFDAWHPRSGSEGIVAPVICHHPKFGEIASIIKLFNHVVPNRNKRQSYLVRTGLAGVHDWLYDGVPYCWVDKNVNGLRLYGHITKHVLHDSEGDDFRIIRDKPQMDSFTNEERREMAGQLCNAIVGLEKKGIVHADLSPANIIIGRDHNKSVKCAVIDYDGFISPDIPHLPREYNNSIVRLLGSPGYQHPSLMAKMSSPSTKDDDLFVENDRFSLAVLCYEIMTWSSGLSDSLKRSHLLDPSDLERSVLNVPTAIKNTWREGYCLLEKAVTESNVHNLPSPDEWLKALGFLGKRWESLEKEWSTQVVLRVSKQHGNMRSELIKKILFENVNGGKGNLAVVDGQLKDFSYEYSYLPSGRCENLSIEVDSKFPLIIKRAGITQNLGSHKEPIKISPGDQLLCNGWSFDFQDNSIS